MAPASTGKLFSTAMGARYFRVVYTNGGTGQTTFRLQTLYKANHPKSSNVRPQDARPNDQDMEEVISYQMCFNGTDWEFAEVIP